MQVTTKSAKIMPLELICTRLKSEVPKMLRCQLCSTCYRVLLIDSYLKSISAIKVTTMKNSKVATIKNTIFFHYEKKPSLNQNLSLPVKINGTHKGGHW